MANTIKLKPVQSVGATEIEYEYDQLSEHAISVTYSELKDLRDNKKLIPGIFYRITDFVTTTAQENTISAGYPYDIIVRAVTESSLDENARAALHEGDTHFAQARIDSWVLRYSLDNDQTRFGWADPVNGKGVVYYLKDAWDNECCFDFKNIQYLGSSLYKFTEELGDILDDTAYYFTFHKVGYGDYSDCNGPDFQDDATNCVANVIDVHIDDEPYSRWLPRIVMICPENTYNDIIFNEFKGAGVHDFTLYHRFQYNRINNVVYNVFINGSATCNRFEDFVHDILLVSKENIQALNLYNTVRNVTIRASSYMVYINIYTNVHDVNIVTNKTINTFNIYEICNNINISSENFIQVFDIASSNNITINTSGAISYVKFYYCTYMTFNCKTFAVDTVLYCSYTTYSNTSANTVHTTYNYMNGSKTAIIDLYCAGCDSYATYNEKIYELDSSGKILLHWKSSLLTETGYYKDSATDTTWKAIA